MGETLNSMLLYLDKTLQTYLKNQHTRMSHGEAELCTLSIFCWVKTHSVHLKSSCDLQKLVVRFSWSLAAVERLNCTKLSLFFTKHVCAKNLYKFV